MPQRVRQEQGSSVFGLAIERRCQRSPMNGIGEEEAPTTPTKTVPLELVLRNPLVGEGVSGGASARTRNAYNLRPAPSCLLWIFNCNLEPKFHVHSYLSLAVLRLHDTMATINLDNVKFYQPPSTAEPIGKNPMVTFQHKGETAGDTRGGDAGM
jgi:hypothetical protein